MKPKLHLGLALVLSGGLFCQLADAQGPGKTAPPAAKDAYVAAQLAELFAGSPVRVVVHRAFNNWLLVDVSAVDAKAGLTNRPTTGFSVSLFSFDNEAAARANVQEELHFFTSPVALVKTGYDEFYSGKKGRLIGRCGAIVVSMDSSPPNDSDAVFAAVAKNLSANPALLHDLIHYALTMHFGDAAPLRALLSKLNDKVPELSAARISTNQPDAGSSVTATYYKSSDYELTIIANAYDSVKAAREGQEFDSEDISVAADTTEIVQGVKVHEYTRYGGIYFQTGCYTFRFETFRQDGKDLLPLMLKVSSALITELN